MLDLAPISLVVGRNNSGKSALLRAAYLAQAGARVSNRDIRYGAGECVVEMKFSDLDPAVWNTTAAEVNVQVTHAVGAGGVSVVANNQGVGPIPSTEPGAFFRPVFSTRRVPAYGEPSARARHKR